jgi:hypothetical protein
VLVAVAVVELVKLAALVERLVRIHHKHRI